MAMFDINGEEFLVGDALKVIKGGIPFRAGTVLVCLYDDGSGCCEFFKLGEDPKEGARWITNSKLQKL